MTTVAGATDVGTLASILAGIRNTQATIANLETETATGYISTTYDGLGSAAAPALDLTSALALNKTQQDNATAAATVQQVTQTALGQIQTLVSGISNQLLSSSTQTNTGLNTLATQARGALTQIASLLDTQSGDVYVFAGQDSQNPPVPDPANITSSSFYSAISGVLAGLDAQGASATQAQILSAAAPGASSPFSATLEASNATATVDLGNGDRVQVGVLADQNSNAVSTGVGTTSTGSYVRDILAGLATLGNLGGAQASDTNVQALLGTVQTVLSGAGTALDTDIGGLGVRQDVITSAQTDLTDTATALTTQLGNLQDSDAATVATQLAQAQTQLQSSFSIISGLQSLSLAKYLT